MSKTVRFTRDYDHPVKIGVEVAYKAGMSLAVPDAHADAAIAVKAAEIAPAQPPQSKAPDAR